VTESQHSDGAEPPKAGPPPVSAETAQTGILVRAIEAALVEPLKRISELRSDNRTDQKWMLTAFAAGFLLLAGMMITGYHWLDERIIAQSTRLEDRLGKTDDRVNSLGSLLTRVDQKLQDLLDRIPPQPTAPPRRQ
jgi:hypothetical protein